VILYLFDIDGTLLHAHGSGRGAFDAVMAEHHGIPDASKGIRYGGKTDPAIVDEIYQARLGRRATPEEHAAFVAAYLPRLQAMLTEQGVQVLDGVLDTLRYLAERADRVRLGIATGNVREGARAKLAAAGLDTWFDCGGYGSDSPVRSELVARARRSRRSGGDRRR